MVVVAVVSGTTKSDNVVIEAARQADDRGTDVHVLYVLGLGWYANLELLLSERLGIPTGIETIRESCQRKAERIAEPILEEYEAVGLVGRPIDEIIQYVRQVDGNCVVLDSEANWGAGFKSLYRDPEKELREKGIPVVAVY
jgi:hypothetical protein